MKKTIGLCVAFLSLLGGSSAFALGADAFPSIIGSSQDAWKFDFTFYGRMLGSAGRGIAKDELSGKKTGFGSSMRIRPAFFATNGNFVFGSQLGSDIYFGHTDLHSGNGSNHYGYGLAENSTVMIQLRKLYMGYLWNSGAYTSWGIQDLYIPYFNADPAAGIVVGWKNDNYDVSIYYYQLTEGNVYSMKDGGSLFGAKADLTPAEGLSITPFLMGLAQGGRIGADSGADSTPPTSDSINYSDGAKFVGSTGLYAGLGVNYTAPFGLYVDIKAVYLYGKNKPYNLDPSGSESRYSQTRNAFGGMLKVGYALEEMLKAEIFADFRTGSKHDANSSGTNHSFNGGIIEYDADTPPLLIIYNYGDGRQGYQYSSTFGDGYAFTDRGAVTIGADANFTLASFDIGIDLGYAWFAAARSGNKSGIGFEVDLTAAYNLMKGTSLYVQAGLMAPSQGVKDEIASERGSSFRSQMPWMLNFGIKYSL